MYINQTLRSKKKNSLLEEIRKKINHSNDCKISGGDDVKFVFSFREDYLSYFEDDSIAFIELRYNRNRILPISAEECQNIISALLIDYRLVDLKSSRDIAECIMRKFLESDGNKNVEPQQSVDIMELSLYCQLLVELMREREESVISKDLINEKDAHEILANYYLHDVCGKVSKRSITILEDEMLDEDGIKKSISKKSMPDKDLCKLKELGIVNEISDSKIEISHDISVS